MRSPPLGALLAAGLAAAPFFHAPKRASSKGRSVASSVSPTTNSAESAGWKRALCHATRSLRARDLIDFTVPSAGKPHG